VTSRPLTTAEPHRSASAGLAVGQGAYYLVTGVWPLVDDRTFQKITGPKQDLWLVKTVGVLVGVIGAVLMAAGLRRRSDDGLIVALAAGSAAGLGAIDVYYVLRGRIAPVYLADGAAQALLVACWARAARAG
jgi:hypothetical protein